MISSFGRSKSNCASRCKANCVLGSTRLRYFSLDFFQQSASLFDPTRSYKRPPHKEPVWNMMHDVLDRLGCGDKPFLLGPSQARGWRPSRSAHASKPVVTACQGPGHADYLGLVSGYPFIVRCQLSWREIPPSTVDATIAFRWRKRQCTRLQQHIVQ